MSTRGWIRLGLAALMCVLALVPPAAQAGPALVFEARSGTVLHSHEPFAKWHPASLTKLMTTYVAFRAIRQGRIRLNSPVRMSARAAAEPPSKMGFPVGTDISLDYAIRILMVRSANNVAVAIAESVGGDHDSFIAEMNASAARLGMTDTRFYNAHGLPDARQVTTARDLGLLARALVLEFPEYQYFFETQSIRVGQNVLENHNKLIGRFRGADGMKTGFICSSGFNLAASATRNGRRLIAIVLGAQTARYREQVAAGLLEEGFGRTGGFNLFASFGSSRPTITSLRRPAVVPEPVDMRPYICQRQKMPDHLASFGTTATGSTVAVADPSAPTTAAASLALSAAQIVTLPAAQPSAPVVAFSVPLPRPRPMREGAGGSADFGTVALQARTAPGVPIPLPNPLRLPAR